MVTVFVRIGKVSSTMFTSCLERCGNYLAPIRMSMFIRKGVLALVEENYSTKKSEL